MWATDFLFYDSILLTLTLEKFIKKIKIIYDLNFSLFYILFNLSVGNWYLKIRELSRV